MELKREDLEGVCTRCGGSGRDPDYPQQIAASSGPGQHFLGYAGSGTECRLCNGKKASTTPTGRVLLEFLTKHFERL